MMIPETWKLYGAVALVAVVVGMIGWLALSRAHLQTALVEVKGEWAQCQSVNADWVAKTDQANRAVDAMKAASDRRAQEAVKAFSAAEVVAKHHQKVAQRVMAMKSKEDSCADVRAMVDGYVRQNGGVK